ncbi:MAG: hypothetical protein C5B50_03370 [Verrucomicrobia bacterium]|nr:MAG: hypothetical protein C5B50_03370 [Verrucomicrobiota bacterium]
MKLPISNCQLPIEQSRAREQASSGVGKPIEHQFLTQRRKDAKTQRSADIPVRSKPDREVRVGRCLERSCVRTLLRTGMSALRQCPEITSDGVESREAFGVLRIPQLWLRPDCPLTQELSKPKAVPIPIGTLQTLRDFGYRKRILAEHQIGRIQASLRDAGSFSAPNPWAQAHGYYREAATRLLNRMASHRASIGYRLLAIGYFQ